MKKVFLNLLIIPLLVLLLGFATNAAELEDSQQNQTGVLQIVVMYIDEAGNEHPVQGGSGFLIGDEESGAEYMITAKEVTSVPKETEERIKELYVEKKDREETDLTFAVKAVVKRDVMIDMQLVAESDEMGFAVWGLAQSLYDREALILCDEPIAGASGQKATVLGFPTEPSLEGETVYYTMDEMISKSGMIIGDGKEENVAYLYHNITPNMGMIGGPILNDEGNVVGINQSKEAQEGYYALQMSELIPVLEALGIPYVTTSEVEAQIQAELAAMVHKEDLQQKIAEAEGLESKLYYKDTYAVMTEGLAAAKEVNDNQEATQEEVDAALEVLNTSMAGLKEKPPLWVILTIVFVVVLILGILFAVVWKKTKPQREQKKQKKMEELTVTQSAPVFGASTVHKEDYKKLVAQSSSEFNGVVFSEPRIVNDGYEETTVFQQPDNDSMSINASSNQFGAYLIRKRTGEKIAINRKEFVIGKDPSQTDYCVSGNSAISRAHVVIISNGVGYDVSDKNATNGTYVNGVKVSAFKKVAIKDGDILRLADEDFEFKLS